MSATMSDLLRLSVPERIRLVQDLWDSIAADAHAVPLTAAQREELDRRLDALDADVARGEKLGIPWEEVLRRIRAGG